MKHSTTPALHTDRYELTMLDAALKDGAGERAAVFEVFGRSLPAGRAYGVVAGIDRAIEAIAEFTFTEEQIDWLLDVNVISPQTADYLRDFRFSGTVSGYRDGDIYTANSPLLRVEGTFAECVVLETLVLSILNHDSSVATAAARMVRAARGRTLIEMGSRRTHEESAVHAARAAFIAGFTATSNLEAGFRYGIPTVGTAAHASVLAHADEIEAFTAQIAAQGVGTTLLVDTYDIENGIETAVKAARQFGADGPGAIRIDSGDLLEESIKARAQLDAYGCDATKIVVSGDLDEYKIEALVAADAPIDTFGVGTRLVTGSNCPSPGFVYKLVAIQNDDGSMRPVAKKSASKATSGGRTYAYRVTSSYLTAYLDARPHLTATGPEETYVVEVQSKFDLVGIPSRADAQRIHISNGVVMGDGLTSERLVRRRRNCQETLDGLSPMFFGLDATIVEPVRVEKTPAAN